MGGSPVSPLSVLQVMFGWSVSRGARAKKGRSIMPAPATAPSFITRTSHERPEGELPWTETYEGIDGATDQSLWTVTRVDDDPEHGTYVHLQAVDTATGGPTWTADPGALRGLAAVLLGQARLLEIEDPDYSTPLATGRDLAVLTAAWDTWGGDSWDLAGGLVDPVGA